MRQTLLVNRAGAKGFGHVMPSAGGMSTLESGAFKVARRIIARQQRALLDTAANVRFGRIHAYMPEFALK